MSYARSWFVVVLVASACASGPSAALPPATSPYPPSSREEFEYQNLFVLGFAAGRDGRTSTYCLFGAQLNDPALLARSHGFEDGQAAAAVAYFVRRDERMDAATRDRLCALLATPGPVACAVAQEEFEDWFERAGLDPETAPLQCDATMAFVLHSCRELEPRRPSVRVE